MFTEAIDCDPTPTGLTTQQAADLLNVSRPFVVGLVDGDTIPYQRIGDRRRILLADPLDCKQAENARCAKAADQLTSEAPDQLTSEAQSPNVEIGCEHVADLLS